MNTTQITTQPQDITDEHELDLGIEELEEIVDPGFWEWAGGVAAGAAVAGGVVAVAT